jgi:Uri superfamily endonuclease
MDFPQNIDSLKIPNLPGSYVLTLNNPQRQILRAGRLGNIEFIPGAYAYVGSAMGGLSKRIQHYFKPIQRPHWHIDTLIPVFSLTALWLFPSPTRQECQIARLLSHIPGISYIRGFGSTDCNCLSHLFYLADIEKAPLFKRLKGALNCNGAVEIPILEAP